MATDLKAAPQAAPRHELFVEQQLDRVSKRLHVLDLGLIALLLIALVMAHALLMAVMDLTVGPRTTGWVPVVRYVAWGLSFTGFVWLGILFFVRLHARINPYYAAKQIEEAIPDAKNSVVNWIDLREKSLAPAVKTAIGLRAARDLKTTNPDETIHARKNTWFLAALVSGLLFGLLVLLAREPGRFVSLMKRAFVPMSDLSLARKTRITPMLPMQPSTGALIVEPKTKVHFQVKITGEVPRINTPQAARVLYRYEAEEAWLEVRMEQDEDGTWNAGLLPDQVRLGFTYKIAAGDDETNEFKVEVQSLADARYEVTYHYQPYLHKPDRTVQFPNEGDVFPIIKGPVGTEVTLVVHTNRELHNGAIEMIYANGVNQLDGQLLAKDRNAFRVKFMLETSGKFRVSFVTNTGKLSNDTNAYELLVVPDDRPNVQLLKPGKEITLPANGTLQLEGLITDDFGIKQVLLRLEAMHDFDRIPLAGKVYRPGNNFQFQDGSFADRLEYKDFVVLSELKDLDDRAVRLAKGDSLYYWLEATDHCDYPRPNEPGRSKTFKVVIGDSEDAAKQNQEKKQAQREQQEHEKRQDQDLKQQEQDRLKKQQAEKPAAAENNENKQNDNGANAEKQKQIDDFLKEQFDKKQKQGDAQPGQNQQAGGTGQKKELSKEEVDRLKDLAKKDGAEGDLARKALKEASEGAKNDDVRKEAKDALKNLPQQPDGKTTPQDVKDLKDLMKKDDGRLGQAAAEQLQKTAKESTDDAVKKSANEALKDAKPQQTDPAQKKELTPQDLRQLNEMMKKDGALKDLAEKELKNAEQSKDKDLSQAAQDALKNQPQKKITPEDVEQMSKLLQDKGRLGQMAREQLEKAMKDSDKATRDAAAKALKDQPSQAGDQPNKPEQKKDFSKEDIDALNKALEDKGPLGDFARKQLQQALDTARDDAVKKAAQQSLSNQNQPSAKDVEELKKLADDPGPLGQMVREQMKKIAEKANDKAAREAADNALKNTPPPVDKKQDATEKDVDKLKKMLDKPGAQGEFAKQGLEKIAKETKDGRVRASANEALKKAEEGSAAKATADDVEKLKKLAGGKGAVSDPAKEQLKKIAEHAENADAKQAAKDALQQLRNPVDVARDDALMKADPSKNVTMAQVNDLKNQAKKKGTLGEAARGELEEAKRLAKNPEVRQAAKEALDDLAKQKSEELTTDDVGLLSVAAKEKGQRGEAAARELDWLAKNGADQKVRDAAAAALKELQKTPTKHDPIKEAKLEDVKALEKDINKEGLLGDRTAQTLSQIARQANDAQVRQAAKEALDKRDPLKQEALTPKDVEKLQKDFHEETGPAGDAFAREMFRIMQGSKDAKVRETALEALKAEKIDPQTMQKEKHGGALTLEALKRIPREVVEKELGFNWQDWLRRLDALQDDPQTLRGDPSLSGNTGPNRADAPNANSTNSQGNLGTAPPGFSDPFIRWTTGRNPERK